MKYIQKNRKVLKLFEKNKKDKAIEFLNKSIEKNEELGLNSLILYEIYAALNNKKNGITVLENTINSKELKNISYKLEILLILGNYYHKKGEYKKAFFYYKNALNIKKNDEKTLIKLGFLYFDIERISNAGKIFNFLYKSDNKNLIYKTLFALYLCESGNMEKSKKLIAEVLNEKQNFYSAYFVSGYSNYKQDKYKEAVEDFEKAKHGKEFKFKALYYAGKSEINLNKNLRAVEYLEEAAALIECENKTTLDLRYSLALCYEKNLDYHSALEQLRRIHKVNPQYKDIAEKLISDNYKNPGNNYLIDYNTYSDEQFLIFSRNFLASFDLEILSSKIMDDNSFIFNTKVNKTGIIHKLLTNIINYSKSDTLLAVFLRIRPVKEKLLESLISGNKTDFSKCIVFSSGPVSPIAVSFAHKNNMKIVNPTQLNKILEKYYSRAG